MPLYSSSDFTSLLIQGKDWREISTQILKSLNNIPENQKNWTIGFIYVTDHVADDAESIFNLIRSVLKIEHWVGTVGVGVCGMAEAAVDRPAISLLLGNINTQDFYIFPNKDGEIETPRPPQYSTPFTQWLDHNDPMLTLVHGDPFAEKDPSDTMEIMNGQIGGFMVGGLSASRGKHFQFADIIQTAPLSGVIFSDNVKVATALSQGCVPIGKTHTVTRADDFVVHTLDNREALSVFKSDLDKIEKAMPASFSEKTSQTIEQSGAENSANVSDDNIHDQDEIHAAFPVSESDQNDYLVRNIVTVDPNEGSIVVAHRTAVGERMMFVRRNDQTMRNDLSKSLIRLRERIQREHGTFAPKAGIYVSCAARAFWQDQDGATEEMNIIREIIGDIPLTGFYAGGEISNARLYGYTGILTLFL